MAARERMDRGRAARARGTGGRKASRPGTAAPRLHGMASDIVGLLLVVLAVALAVALLLPSSAPVTRASGEMLVLLFGSGALLLPLSLLLFALTFFMGEEESLSGKVAFGLALVTLSVLSIASVTYPGAQDDSSLVLAHDVLRARGGYVGGGIAWALLQTVGREVGIVVLVGTIVAGIVVCGFSISDAVGRLRSGARAARDSIHAANEQRRVRRDERRERRQLESDFERASYQTFGEVGPAPQEQGAEPETTYLGARTSTVLTRAGHPSRGGVADGAEMPTTRLPGGISEAVTTLLDRVRPMRDARAQADDQVPAGQPGLPWEPLSEVAADDAVAPGAMPDFLVAPAQAGSRGRKRPTRRGRQAPPQGVGPDQGSSRSATPQAASPTPAERQGVRDASVRVSDASSAARPGDADETYTLPPLSMLSSNPQSAQSASSKAELDQTMAKLQGTLREFGLSSRVVDYVSGPLVTTFRVEMGEGERVSRVKNLEDDIALTLAAEKVRIFAPIAGTSFVGVEIPNKTRQNVHLGDVLPYATGGQLEVAIGRDSSGRPVIADIAKMPHMLVAGTTGSGKSVMINSMIMSLLMRATPKQVRLIMVDPKRVEFKGYNGIPHLYVPVVTEPRQAASALQWAVSEMERRLKVFERAGARNITVYNTMCSGGKLSEMDNPPEPMPYLVIVIDELSDLMIVAGKDVEASIVRIAQLARAAGIHLVLATQRPSANVVTGLIKSNIDSRVALKVSSGIDSRVILDETGADRLLGNGDMLFKDRGLAPKRVLGCYTSDPEIEAVVDFIRNQGEPDYHEEILSAVVPGQPGSGGGAADDEDDPLVWEAAQIVVESQLGSTSGLQRRLKVGYARAGRIMDMLESKGVVGPGQGSKPREVLLDEDGLEDLRVLEETYREV
ncbi:MAG: DNA translocase FtsK [Acidobacteriota bacterium]|nr:DNA translocase FtsK [Acidobacteriota bacterium]